MAELFLGGLLDARADKARADGRGRQAEDRGLHHARGHRRHDRFGQDRSRRRADRRGAVRRPAGAAHRPEGRPDEPLPDVSRPRCGVVPPVGRRGPGEGGRPVARRLRRRAGDGVEGRPRRLGLRTGPDPQAARHVRLHDLHAGLAGRHADQHRRFAAGARRSERRRDDRRRDRGLRVRPARARRHRGRPAVEPRAHPAVEPDPARVVEPAVRSTWPTLVGQVQQPPINQLGVFELDQFFPPKDRQKLAMQLNGLLASPSFAAWGAGTPLDIAGPALPRTASRGAPSSRRRTCPTRSASSSRRSCCRSSSRGCGGRAAPPTCGRSSTWTRWPATCRRRRCRRRRSRS